MSRGIVAMAHYTPSYGLVSANGHDSQERAAWRGGAEDPATAKPRVNATIEKKMRCFHCFLVLGSLG